MELKKFKFNCEIQKYNNPKTNTCQVWGINLTIFNIWVQLFYIK